MSDLLFYFDDKNIKSYKGPPISNLATSITPANQSGTGESYVSGTELVNIPTVGQTEVKFCNIQNNYPSVSNNCCPAPFNYFSGGSVSVSGSTLYTYSILYRIESGYTHPNYLYRYEYNTSTYVTEAGIHNDSNRVHLGDGWYWAWGSFTTQPSTNLLYPYSFYYKYSASSDKLSIAKILLTPGNYTQLHPKFWPTVNNTRLKSEVLKDLTNKNSISPYNLNINSYTTNSNSITLDGNNQYLYTNGDNYWNAWSPNGVNGNPSMTIELIFNSNDTGGYLVSRPWNGSGQYNYLMSNGSFSLWSNASSSSLGYSSICTGSNVHVVWWMNPTHYGVYKNGEVYVSATAHGLSGGGGSGGTNAFGTLFGSLYPYGEGWEGNTGFSVSGKYYNAKIYNRVLSAQEIQQNFNATRGRYGL
jgi:hypothetical protein